MRLDLIDDHGYPLISVGTLDDRQRGGVPMTDRAAAGLDGFAALERALAADLCWDHEPDPAKAGLTPQTFHVDDACRMQASRLLADPGVHTILSRLRDTDAYLALGPSNAALNALRAALSNTDDGAADAAPGDEHQPMPQQPDVREAAVRALAEAIDRAKYHKERALWAASILDHLAASDEQRGALAVYMGTREDEAYARGRLDGFNQAATPDNAAAAPGDAERLRDYDAMRVAQKWPTPEHMRRAADALDIFTPAKYGDVLRWFADRCDEWVWHMNDPKAKERLEAALAALDVEAGGEGHNADTDTGGEE